MSKYLLRYKGKYRVLAPLDTVTNDFPRNAQGDIETEDFYIPCKSGAMIYHYGHSVLEAFIPSTIRANNVLKDCEENNINVIKTKFGDGEAAIRFNANDIEFFANRLGAKTMGKDISPFSTKNLPKSDYVLSDAKLQEYKDTLNKYNLPNLLVISTVMDEFLYKTLSRKHKIKIRDDMSKKCMRRQPKEYIDSMGEWENFIKYLNKNFAQYGLKEV